MDKSIIQTLEKCSLCGFCKVNCPVYKAELKESSSPRAKILKLKKNIEDIRFYDCTLCKACVVECPAEVDMKMRSIRSDLVNSGKETEANKRMIENIRRYGNPFGEAKDTKPKELYCC
ncbi:MAG: (Fe-S)-binding protein [Candidatus Woesearchaeota archaeon]